MPPDGPSAPRTGDGNISLIVFIPLACMAAVAVLCFAGKWRRALDR